MFTSLIRVDHTGQVVSIYAFFAIDAVLAIFTLFVIAILDSDIDGGSRRSISTFRTRQADVADTVFTGNRNSIFAILTRNADFTVDTVFAGFTLRTGDGNTIFTLVANHDVIVQLQVIGNLAGFFIRSCMEQDIISSIRSIFRTGCLATFYGQCRMRGIGFLSFRVDFIVDILQIAKVSCILQSITGCCSNRGILTFCIFGTIEGTLYISDSCTILTSKSNLSFIGI